jgi:hypothetical protein
MAMTSSAVRGRANSRFQIATQACGNSGQRLLVQPTKSRV